MEDIFNRFIDLYGKGDISESIRLILPHPGFSYDSLDSTNPLFPHIVNYIDACIFEGSAEAFQANQCVLSLISKNSRPDYVPFILRVQLELKLLYRIFTGKDDYPLPASFTHIVECERHEILLEEDKKKSLLNSVDKNYKALFQEQLMLSQNWIAFKKKKNACSFLYKEMKPGFFRPLHQLNFDTPTELNFLSQEGIPLIFLEPLKGPFTNLLQAIDQRPSIFVFETLSSLVQMLQYPEILNALSKSDHLLYILEFYPNAQFAIQDHSRLKGKSFQPILLSQNHRIQKILPVFEEALMKCISQPEQNLNKDTKEGSELYQLAQKFLYSTKAHRLGISRAYALFEYEGAKRWHDKHKNTFDKVHDVTSIGEDLMATKLSQIYHQGKKDKEPKLKLIHVVPQIVDGGHAPSRLLDILVKYHNPELFSLAIISTERLQMHSSEYPLQSYPSDSSSKRASQRLAYFYSQNIPVAIVENAKTYEQSAHQVAALLNLMQPDIIVFHGPDSINYQCANMVNTALKVLFEHGTIPEYPGFDLVIASSTEAPKIYQSLFERIGAKVETLPFCIDVRDGWLPQPIPRKTLGLPEQGQIMTTISYHLDSRLTNDMRLAIAEILKRVPQAYYAPIGPIGEKNKFMQFFQQYGVEDRIILVGPQGNPSQWARSMNLYLNEFPFGSGLGILDAMAAGCPVVSMYDVNGPPQGRYGGDYFGIDRAIISGKPEDYVDLACRLLTDPILYQEWSEHAKKRYELHANVKSYVKDFEDILIKSMSYPR